MGEHRLFPNTRNQILNYFPLMHFYFLFFPILACCRLCMKCSDGKASPSTRQRLSLQCSTRRRQVSLWDSRSLSPTATQGAHTHACVHLTQDLERNLLHTTNRLRWYYPMYTALYCLILTQVTSQSQFNHTLAHAHHTRTRAHTHHPICCSLLH